MWGGGGLGEGKRGELVNVGTIKVSRSPERLADEGGWRWWLEKREGAWQIGRGGGGVGLG